MLLAEAATHAGDITRNSVHTIWKRRIDTKEKDHFDKISDAELRTPTPVHETPTFNPDEAHDAFASSSSSSPGSAS